MAQITLVTFAEVGIEKRIDDLRVILDNVWILICSIMVFLVQVGFLMKETGSIRMIRNSSVLLKTILVMGTSCLTFFLIGFGFSIKAKGGLLGQEHFVGVGYEYSYYSLFVYYLSLSVMMAAIATGAIAERTATGTYIFYSFLNSGFIFPLGLAWSWNDGWLSNLGFLDRGGAAIVHLMGGMSGFIGTYLIGPRVGIY